MPVTTTAPQTPTTICVTYSHRLAWLFVDVCQALYLGNGVAVVSGVFVIGRVNDLLNDVRDWLSDVLKRL
jgi:hypothetical protein